MFKQTSPTRPAQAEQQQQQPPQEDNGDLYAGGAGLTGGLLLGAGGAYLGMTAGIEYALRATQMGGGTAGSLLGLLVGIPMGVVYGGLGAAVGGTVGAATGVAVGYGAYHAFKK